MLTSMTAKMGYIILDMDSSESPTHGEQEGLAWNGHFGCSCYYPLFVFNQRGLYAAFQLAEVAVPRALFAEILRRIERLRPKPPPLAA